MKKLLIVGASGHGKVIANIAHDCKMWSEIAFLDDDLSKVGQIVSGYKVIDTSANAKLYIEDYNFIVGIGDNYLRKEITNRLKKIKGKFATIIHPSVTVGRDVEIGPGTVVMPMAVINVSSTIKEGSIINTGSKIDHDCLIGSFTHISPGVTICGGVTMDNNTWIGAGVTIIQNISIVNDCIVGAGSTVINNIDESGVYIGTPAVITKKCFF